MAKIPIWPGSSSFDSSLTPFSFYDSDTSFQTDAVKPICPRRPRSGGPAVAGGGWVGFIVKPLLFNISGG